MPNISVALMYQSTSGHFPHNFRLISSYTCDNFWTIELIYRYVSIVSIIIINGFLYLQNDAIKSLQKLNRQFLIGLSDNQSKAQFSNLKIFLSQLLVIQ